MNQWFFGLKEGLNLMYADFFTNNLENLYIEDSLY